MRSRNQYSVVGDSGEVQISRGACRRRPGAGLQKPRLALVRDGRRMNSFGTGISARRSSWTSHHAARAGPWHHTGAEHRQMQFDDASLVRAVSTARDQPRRIAPSSRASSAPPAFTSKQKRFLSSAWGRALVERFMVRCRPPWDKLVTLPGWRKTANVILGNAFASPNHGGILRTICRWR